MFRIAYNSLVLEQGSGYSVSNLGGCDIPPIRTSSQQLSTSHGGNIWKQLYAMRTITIEGLVYASDYSTYEELKRKLSSTFSIADDNVLQIRKWDGEEKHINAKVTTPPRYIDGTGRMKIGEFMIELLCSDPFFYDTGETTGTAVLATSTGGSPVPMPVPMPIGGIVGNKVILNNSGEIAVYPTVTITGTVDNPTVTNVTTGESFTVTDSFTGNDTLQIYQDQSGLYVLKNGVNSMSNFLGSFFTLG